MLYHHLIIYRIKRSRGQEHEAEANSCEAEAKIALIFCSQQKNSQQLDPSKFIVEFGRILLPAFDSVSTQ